MAISPSKMAEQSIEVELQTNEY